MNLKMSFKKLTIGALILTALLSSGMLYFAKDIRETPGIRTLFISGPRFYPIALAVLMIVFCVISIIDTLKKPDKILEFPNAHKAVVTAAVTIIWIALWQYMGYFYLISFIAMGIILFYLNPAPASVKKICSSLAYDSVIIIFIYLTFAVALKMNL